MTYRIPRGERAEDAPFLEVGHFHPHSSAHHPVTRARLVYDAAALHVRFDVEDRYVLCRHTAHQSSVCKDSCVELFFSPTNDERYFNVEMNCGGAVLLHYNGPSGDRYKGALVDPSWLDQLRIETSVTPPLEPEQDAPLTWWVRFSVPFALVEAYSGVGAPQPGTQWHGNFYKCADASSHPHWGSWAPTGEKRNFHQPKRFAPLQFA